MIKRYWLWGGIIGVVSQLVAPVAYVSFAFFEEICRVKWCFLVVESEFGLIFYVIIVFAALGFLFGAGGGTVYGWAAKNRQA
jgi:hypothetical protein